MPPSPTFDPGHYHLHLHPISKLKGHSIQAAAAYRRAERFEGNSVTAAAAYRSARELGNDSQVFDYRRKVGVAWTGILAPECTPKELLDAQTLWNTVERIESRKNARMAKEMIIALPHQVDLSIHIAMLRAFITTHLVSLGMIADVAIHKPPVEHGGDPRNWHAHVLLTDRPMTPEGFAATKDRMWNAKENLLLWRKAWADIHNATMEHLGLPHRIDHRSLEAQRQDALARGDTIAALDLDREPQIHVGKALHVTHPEHTIYADLLSRNQAILTRNKNRGADRVEHTRKTIAAGQNEAHLEARINALKRDLWQPDPEPLTLAELEARHGRRPSPLTRFMAPRIAAEGHKVARLHGWTDRTSAATSLDILGFLTIQTNLDAHQPRTPRRWFEVTAKDLAFFFYGIGLIDKAQLQRSLEPDPLARSAVAKGQPPTRPRPPRFSTPHADTLAKLRREAPIPEGIYHKRLAQLAAFNARHQAKAVARRQRTTERLARAMKRRDQNPVGTGG